jgi:hypothetical protein
VAIPLELDELDELEDDELEDELDEELDEEGLVDASLSPPPQDKPPKIIVTNINAQRRLGIIQNIEGLRFDIVFTRLSIIIVVRV